jgi:hypothetical protein
MNLPTSVEERVNYVVDALREAMVGPTVALVVSLTALAA